MRKSAFFSVLCFGVFLFSFLKQVASKRGFRIKGKSIVSEEESRVKGVRDQLSKVKL